MAGILDYVGSDYAAAVDASGHVVNDLEYREQRTLAEEALALVREVGLSEDEEAFAGLRELEAKLEAKAPPAEVRALCRAIRAELVRTHGLVLTPHRPPDPVRAQKLYFENGCHACHGEDGSAATALARELSPAPANFLDPERVASVSPHRAYHAITHGVRGTRMAAYEALSDDDRWSLAFWVLSLRHRARDPNEGRALAKKYDLEEGLPLGALSAMTEDDLVRRLEKRKVPPDEREAALAYLRAVAPFSGGRAEQGLDVARELLARGLAAYRRGDRKAARQAFIAAYLDGFEPHEAGLVARNPDLVLETEKAMLRLREATRGGASPRDVERDVEVVLGLLDEAEGSRLGGRAVLFGAAAIALREGFEAVLLIAALLALVRRRGTATMARHVHAGWIAAVVLGLVTWFALGEILGGLERELAEGIIALVAAVVLLMVTHWIVGQVTAKQWMGFVAKRLGEASGRLSAAGVFTLSFIAVYREAFETVLFYQALLLDAATHTQMVWIGLGLGLAALAVAALVLRQLGRHLRPRPFMIASGALLAVLSLMLLGKGVRALQEAGVFHATEVLGLVDVPWLGFHATLEGMLAQGVLFVLLVLSGLWPWLSMRRAAAQRNESPAE